MEEVEKGVMVEEMKEVGEMRGGNKGGEGEGSGGNKIGERDRSGEMKEERGENEGCEKGKEIE